MNYIKCIYKRSIFKSDKGYYIGLCKIVDTNDENIIEYKNKMITFTGYFPDLKIDDTYLFYGEMINHPKYGTQYQVNEYERVKPEGKDGIIEFLSSDLFNGIGEKLAKKIVDSLGENCLDLILKNPNCLTIQAKVSPKKAKLIANTLTEYEESHQIIVYLNELGFTMRDSLLVYNTYKSNTINNIENNIYQLIEDCEELTFKKIDIIASSLKIKKDDDRRVKTCIIYIIKELLFKNGDTYLYFDEIIQSVTNYLGFNIDNDAFENYLEELINEEKIDKYENKYYLKTYKDAEDEIINKIKYLSDLKPKKIPKLDENINELEKINGIIYNDTQKKAIKSSLNNNITIITGGPGTGKTTIIKAICDLYLKINNKVDPIEDIALLAPTGRASKRMSETTNLPASTIHRFLKWNKESNKFSINEYNKNYSKLIIVDEVSMIDLELLYNLFKGLTNNIQIIMVGDYNQLPSVGSGQVLKDLIDSEIIDTIYLDTLYRQNDESYIPLLANDIKNNELSEFLNPKDDYLFLECSSDNIVSNIKNLCKQMIQKGYDSKKVQFMAPMYSGLNGIDNLNKELQNIFNPYELDKTEIKIADVTYRVGDKILQLVNMPEENVFNGDIGYIKYIITSDISESKKDEIYVDYDNNLVKYLINDLNKIKHGFIISIHKSQGSEFELVLMVICKNFYRMLYKKLIYTGITRAKKKLIILGEANAFRFAVSNDSEQSRKTNLKERLKNMYNLNK